jgi:hypothetical protein
MWTDPRQATAWAFGWLLLVAALFILTSQPRRFHSSRLAALSLPSLLLIAWLARLVPAVLLPVGAGYDIESFRLVTDALLGGREVYTSVLGRHPYLPFQMYIMGGMAALTNATGLPYVIAIKMPALLADVALTGVVYLAVKRKTNRESATYRALLYALNPVSVLVTVYHGQFEAITLLLAALAWWAWDEGRRWRSAVALGFAVLNKTWPVILLPLFFIRLPSWRARAVYGLISLGIPALFVIGYLLYFDADPMPMLRRALTHRGVAGYWGPGAVLSSLAQTLPELQPLVDGLFGLRNGLLAAAVLFALWWTRREPVLEAIVTTLLALLAVTVGFGIQWLLWIVPFALLAGEDLWLKRYSLAGALMLTVHLYGLHLYPWLNEWLTPATANWVIRLSALPVWIIVVLWMAERLRHPQPRPATGQLRDSPAG